MTAMPFRRVLFGSIAVALFAAAPAQTQLLPRRQAPPPAPAGNAASPKLEAVAETKLLMEGLVQPNFRGLERTLKDKPAEVAAWTFARGQALLVAESGNLLLMRPPRGAGQDAWFERAAELRENATRLARMTASQNLAGSRLALQDLTGSCNRCHQKFGVPTAIAALGKDD